jgi:hypothetical protein
VNAATPARKAVNLPVRFIASHLKEGVSIQKARHRTIPHRLDQVQRTPIVLLQTLAHGAILHHLNQAAHHQAAELPAPAEAIAEAEPAVRQVVAEAAAEAAQHVHPAVAEAAAVVDHIAQAEEAHAVEDKNP